MRFSALQNPKTQDATAQGYQLIDSDFVLPPVTARYIVDSSRPRILTLPSYAVNGTIITLLDGVNFSTNNTTVVRTGSTTISGTFENLVMDSAGAGVELVFFNGDWKILYL